jgi:hypothetical protein
MQVNRAAPASTASTPPSTPPASSRDADAYRSDWQPSRVTPALHSAPSVSSSPRPDGADSPQQRAANDRDSAVVPFSPGAEGLQPAKFATLSPVTAPTASAKARLAANDAPDLQQVHINALLAKDVYNDVPSPPAGYRAASFFPISSALA